MAEVKIGDVVTIFLDKTDWVGIINRIDGPEYYGVDWPYNCPDPVTQFWSLNWSIDDLRLYDEKL